MKKRALLTIIIALLTGFLVGYITANQVRHIKTRDVRTMSSVHTFKDRTIELINPTDEQIKLVSPIIDNYAMKFDSLKKQTYGEYQEFLEEFHNEIFPYLQEEQIVKMQDFAKNFKKKSHNKGKDDKPGKEN